MLSLVTALGSADKMQTAERDAILASGGPLRAADSSRFQYSWAVDADQPRMGTAVSLRQVQELVNIAID